MCAAQLILLFIMRECACSKIWDDKAPPKYTVPASALYQGDRQQQQQQQQQQRRQQQQRQQQAQQTHQPRVQNEQTKQKQERRER